METEGIVSEDVGTVSVGLQVTGVPDISLEFANAMFGYQQNLFTVDTGTSAVGMRVGNQSLPHMILTFFSPPPAPDDYTSITALVNVFYNLASSSFVLSPDTAMLMITDDSDPEDTEEVTLNLTPGFFSGGRNIVILSPNETRVIITDNDGKPIKNKECNQSVERP